MKIKKQESLKKVFESYSAFIDRVAQEIIDELKSNSRNYKDMDETLSKFKKVIFYECPDKGKFEYLFKRIEELIEQEKNDLPITNRSN